VYDPPVVITMGPLGTAGGVGPAAASCGGFELAVLPLAVEVDDPDADDAPEPETTVPEAVAPDADEPEAAEPAGADAAGIVRLNCVVAAEELCDPLLA